MLENYFFLQLTFALHYAKTAKVPLEKAIAICTNLRRRLNLSTPGGTARWDEFLARVCESRDHPDELRSTWNEFYEALHQPAASSPFGCFCYEQPNAAGVVRIHFLPPAAITSSPLAASCADARASELREMFRHISRTEKGAVSVLGISWLYNLEAYNRLFPAPYVASIRRPWFPLHLTGSSTWGQVLDWRQQVKPAMREKLLCNLQHLKPDTPWGVFPLEAKVTTCEIEAFYELFA